MNYCGLNISRILFKYYTTSRYYKAIISHYHNIDNYKNISLYTLFPSKIKLSQYQLQFAPNWSQILNSYIKHSFNTFI